MESGNGIKFVTTMNRKKQILNFAALAVAAILSGNLVSCSGNNGESYIPSPTITDKGGNKVLVTGVGSQRFTYDENGKLASMSYRGETITLQGDKFSFGKKDGSARVDVYLGSDGLITKIQFVESDTYETDEGSIEYSYSSDRRLKSINYSVKGTDKYGGSYGESVKAAYTWKDGNLMQAMIEGNESGQEDGESFSESYTQNFTFSYGNVPNVSKQLPYYMADDITVIENIGFCAVGLLGYGPNYLPTGYTETESSTEDGKPGKQRTHTYTLTFTQNSNGTLKSEARNGSSISYTYADAPTRADTVEAQSTEEFALSMRPSFFRHRRK